MLERLIQERLDLGKERYGQGVKVFDNYDWFEMALEEFLDGMVYTAAAYLKESHYIQKTHDDNSAILSVILHRKTLPDGPYKKMLNVLANTISEVRRLQR